MSRITGYITLDDLNQLKSASQDPIGFIQNLSAEHIIIDEIQRAPELFLPLKQFVDETRTPGKFLVTGSADALALPQLSDSLAGRMEVISLLPLAACEISGCESTFFENILNGEVPTTNILRVRKILIERIINGGFPSAIARESEIRRSAWYVQYINSIIEKDVKDLGHIENIDVMRKLVGLLAHRVGQLVNITELAGKLAISRQTITRYQKLLEQIFIFNTIPAWHLNDGKRVIKSPKLHIVDTGLLCALKRININKLSKNLQLFGSLLESYVLNELKRLATWFPEPLYFYHYRDKDKVEVDIVIETISGEVIGIEVKATATLHNSDFRGLKRLQQLAGDKFLMGLLLYDGDHKNIQGENIYSIPIGAIWE